MKTYLKCSFAYALLAMAGGVFFREFTKFNGFEGVTSLGVMHTHAFVLGMLFFLIVLLVETSFHLATHKRNRLFLSLYNVGLITTITMLVIRGITQVLAISLSSGFNASISGIAGIGHIILSAGILVFFSMLKDQVALKK